MRQKERIDTMKKTKFIGGAAAAIAVMMLLISAAFAEEEVSVTLAAQKDGAFLFVPQKVKVSKTKAEEYGIEDIDDGVTFADALITMHEIKYGTEFTKTSIDDYVAFGYIPATTPQYDDYHFIDKAFGEPAFASGFFINDSMVSTTYEKTLIHDGDNIMYAFYMDTEYYMDCYTSFVPKNINAICGEEITLDMCMIDRPMSSENVALEPIADEYEFEALTLNLVLPDGSIGEALTDENEALIIPDENGRVTVSFDEPGRYILSASGFIGEDFPIMAPYCFINVNKYAVGEIEVTDKKASVDVRKNADADPGILILAVYDNNGTLESVEIKNADEGTVLFDSTIEAGDIPRVFIWDSLSSGLPLA